MWSDVEDDLQYWSAGPFELERDEKRLISFGEWTRQEFWQDVEAQAAGISTACGCYIFSIRHGRSTTPWYIGKAERQDFKRECFTPHKIKKYNEALMAQRGRPELWFYARTTLGRGDFSKPTSRAYRDIGFLEKMLIGQALRQNPNLVNAKETALLRNMTVPGIINTKKGAPRTTDTELRKMLGY